MKRYARKNGEISNPDQDAYVSQRELISLARVYLKTGFVCWYCGERMHLAAENGTVPNFTLDHRVPLFIGGTNRIENFVYCCGKCNADQNVLWREKVEAFLASKRAHRKILYTTKI